MAKANPLSLALLTGLAILAFAGNSLLARAALADGAIEAGAFSAIRLTAGALILLPFLKSRPRVSDIKGAASLLIYIVCFSFAYLTLSAATGALILFGCVQASVMAIGIVQGDRPSARGWLGLLIALSGLGWLFLPGSQGAAIIPAATMALAGIAWGVYTIVGRGGRDPARNTAANFLLAAPFALPLVLLDSGPPSAWGVGLAIASGAVTSGLGYVIWYRVAPELTLATTATAQLATPVVAALGGALLLAEPLTLDIVIAGGLILGGILLTLRREPAG
ncbi:EamA family transporter [Qipengyuania sp. DGS5-3]|uniref:EamA family transporter n=1 Tax=Qipengyuania sp. DGS5-3 TaxID=3349632 RepID=UPI0036D385DC